MRKWVWSILLVDALICIAPLAARFHLRRQHIAAQQADAKTVVLPAAPLIKEQCLNEKDADTVMVVRIDVPRVIAKQTFEFPLRLCRADEVPSGPGGGYFCAAGSHGGCNIALNLAPNEGADPKTIHLETFIAWDLDADHRSVKIKIPVTISQAHEEHLSHGAVISVRFRAPNR